MNRWICAILLFHAAQTGEAQSVSRPAGAGDQVAGRQIILVTGSTDGLGRAVALKLASTGAHIIVHGRNRDRGLAVVKEIEQESKGSARFFAADFASLAQVRQFADTIQKTYPRIDVLINNAGIWLGPEDGRRLSADGHEMHFAVNYLSGFLLTRLLLPRLTTGTPARIVNVSSAAQQPIQFDDVMLARAYSDSRAYAQSKLAQVMFTLDLARELDGKNVIVSALHPATFMNTGMVTDRGLAPRSSVDTGAEAVVHLVTAVGLRSGDYYNGMRPGRPNAQALDEAAREQLRKLSLDLVGLK